MTDPVLASEPCGGVPRPGSKLLMGTGSTAFMVALRGGTPQKRSGFDSRKGYAEQRLG